MEKKDYFLLKKYSCVRIVPIKPTVIVGFSYG